MDTTTDYRLEEMYRAEDAVISIDAAIKWCNDDDFTDALKSPADAVKLRRHAMAYPSLNRYPFQWQSSELRKVLGYVPEWR